MITKRMYFNNLSSTKLKAILDLVPSSMSYQSVVIESVYFNRQYALTVSDITPDLEGQWMTDAISIYNS